ncbi:uncharacterized protein LOC143256553 [Tachypleus tridentatus]|uniref:uncharacterized protein LOC143256553 n=1 Tax=Tachypleus tridentatus TaxID=6853 RepID=UPI003FCF2387
MFKVIIGKVWLYILNLRLSYRCWCFLRLVMISQLTRKLRSQTLCDSDSFHSSESKLLTGDEPQPDDDCDSGTESDDEAEELQKFVEDVQMESRKTQSRTGRSFCVVTDQHVYTCGEIQQLSFMDNSQLEPSLDSALPSDSDHNFDHHSSEEELELINSTENIITQNISYPGKRKWSQANCLSSGDISGSSDDEICDVLCVSTPLEFCGSPPANVHKPSRSLSPPPKVFHLASANIPSFEVCSVSPCKRLRQMHGSGGSVNASIQRPCLDFEKMQQIRV